MNEIYDVNIKSVDEIKKEASEALQILKKCISPSGAWNCYCSIYIDEKKTDSLSCYNLQFNIETAYSMTIKYLKIEINCRPGIKPPTIEPSFNSMKR